MTFSKTVLNEMGLDSWAALFATDTAEVIRLMDEKSPSVHPGDAFLGVLVVRSVADLEAASERLERLTWWLKWLTWALAVMAACTLVVAIVALRK